MKLADKLNQELAENLQLADVGEVAATVAHEFNSFLNALLLHIAVLELELPPNHRQGLADIRRQGKEMAALIQSWQRYRRRPPAEGRAEDLNRTVTESVEAFRANSGGHVAVRLELAAEPLPVTGQPTELKRLCTFLLRNAAAVTPPNGAITVRSERSEGTAVLRVHDAGLVVAAEVLSDYFDPYPVRRAGTNSLELAACKTMVRRLQGRIAAENGTEKGVIVSVELPLAA